MSETEQINYQKELDVARSCLSRLAMAILTGDNQFLAQIEYVGDSVYSSTWLPDWVSGMAISAAAEEYKWNYDPVRGILKCSQK